jgi:uncharacterized protein (DUF1697 family)
MPTYFALLRGVNVGRNMLKMERLRELWSELGFTNVRTYVQSGNVVFEAAGAPSQWLASVERKLVGESRLPVRVLVRTQEQMGRIIGGNPFLPDKAIDRSKLHVTFLNNAPTRDAVVKLKGVDSGGDQFHVVGEEVYLYCPNGYGQTKLSNNALEKVLSVHATTRNWNTVNTLHEMASSVAGTTPARSARRSKSNRAER